MISRKNIIIQFYNGLGRLMLIVGVLSLIQVQCEKELSDKVEVTKNANDPVIEHYGAVEIIANDMDTLKIKSFLNKKSQDFFQWKNRYVIYDKNLDVKTLSDSLSLIFPTSKIKEFKTPLYNFKRSERCLERKTSKDWKHILLTANLVKDTLLQKEYLEYHKNQFEEWPEVAQGFCNAEFQQLQVFKNERQLLIVISIPKGKRLDDLNPKTTENNPRVNEWNMLMSKYQEGIDGTDENETWVFLNRMTKDKDFN